MNFVIIFTAKYVFLLSIGIFFTYALYLWMKKRKAFFSFSVLSIFSFPLMYIAAKIAGHIIYNPRPFVVDHIKPLIAHAADNGFPSDHALLTATIASVAFAYSKKLSIVLFVIALLIGIARVAAHIHHAEDIIGSFVIAIIMTGISYLIKKRFLKKYN